MEDGSKRMKDILVFDLETTSLNPLEAKIIVGSYLNGTGKIEHTSNEQTLLFLVSSSALVVGHNLKYDLSILGYPETKGVFDTMVAEWLLYPDQRKFGLKYLGRKYFEETPVEYNDIIMKYKPKNMKKSECNLELAPLDEVTEYCNQDVDLTNRIYNILSKELETAGLSKLFYEVEMPFLTVLMEMEAHGVKLDVDYINILKETCEKNIKEAEAKVYELAGERLNLNSPKQLSLILFDKLKIPPTRRKKTGYSTDEKDLRALADKYEIIGWLMKYREANKLYTTYLEALPAHVDKDGRIHTNYSQIGTASGRISSDHPNLQNIPKKGDLGKLIRKAFVPAKGCKFIIADYDQAELRLLAHFSQDRGMLETFRSGKDIHLITAQKLFNKQDISKDERSIAKTVNFAIIYGQTAPGLSKELQIEWDQARNFIYRFACTYPQAWGWKKQTESIARSTKMTTTLLGRKRSLANALGVLERLAVNTPIQGSCADLVKVAMIRLREVLKPYKTRMVLQIHDEVVFEVPEEEIEEVKDLITGTMESVNLVGDIALTCPMIVNIEVKDNWGESDE